MASLKKMREDPRKADILDVKRFLNHCRKNGCKKVILETRGVVVFDDGTYFFAFGMQNECTVLIANRATATVAATAISEYSNPRIEYPEEEKWERFLEENERALECVENSQEAHNAESR